MTGRTSPLGLGSPLLKATMLRAVGESCTLSWQDCGERAVLSGSVAAVMGGTTTLSLSAPAGPAPGAQVVVEVPAVGLCFESAVERVVDETELQLGYPLWATGAERRSVPRTEVQAPCRIALAKEGTRPAWVSGTVENINSAGVGLLLAWDLPPGTDFRIRLTVPHYPTPLMLRAKSVWSAKNGQAYRVGAEFTDLSVQAEEALQRAYGGLSTLQDEGVGRLVRALSDRLNVVLQIQVRRGGSLETAHPLFRDLLPELEACARAMWEEAGWHRRVITLPTGVYHVYGIPLDGTQGVLAVRDMSAIIQVSRRHQQTILHLYREVLYAATEGRLLLADPLEIDDLVGEPIWQKTHPIGAAADVARCRELTMSAMREEGMPPKYCLEVALSVSEAVTNALKHAGGGEFRLVRVEMGWSIVVNDQGPGINLSMLPLSTLLRGYSTKSSLGLGFTAMLRCLDRLVLASSEAGTTVLLKRGDPAGPATEAVSL